MEAMQEPQEEMRAAKGALRPEDRTPAVVLDFETTGLDAREDRIIQIGACHVHGREDREFEALVNPEGRKSGEKARAVHGISDEALARERPFRDQLPALLAFCKGLPIIAHNADFDLAFLAEEVKRCGDPAGKALADPKRWSCSMAAARRILPLNRSWSLDSVAKTLGVRPRASRKKHDALIDAELLARCWRRLGGCEPDPEQAALFQGGGGGKPPWIERIEAIRAHHSANRDSHLLEQVQEHGAAILS